MGGGGGREEYTNICLNIVGVYMSGQRLWGTSAQIIFSGGGDGNAQEIFWDRGDGRIYKHTFVYIRVGADHIWPVPRGNLC